MPQVQMCQRDLCDATQLPIPPGITQEVTAAYSGLFAQLLGRLLETDPDRASAFVLCLCVCLRVSARVCTCC